MAFGTANCVLFIEVSSFFTHLASLPPSVQPATVSRCGMIYLEPSTFGWRPIFTSWLMQLPPALADHTPLITSLVDWLVVPCLDLVQRQLKGEVVTIPLHHLYVVHYVIRAGGDIRGQFDEVSNVHVRYDDEQCTGG